MKNSSFLLYSTLITIFIVYPDWSLASYSGTLENSKYATQEIDENIFIAATTFHSNQPFRPAPVFKLLENEIPSFYKWIMPDLETYKTSDGLSIFSKVSTTVLPNDYFDVPYLNDTGSTLNMRYQVNNSFTDGERQTAFNNNDLITNFVGIHTTNSNHDGVFGGAINNAGQIINYIDGQFINNSVDSDNGYVIGGAIYNNDGTINNVNGDFVHNKANFSYYECNGINCPHSHAIGGAVANIFGTIMNMNGNFIVNEAYSKSGPSYGGAIYNSGNLETIKADFLYNDASSLEMYGSGGAIANDGEISNIIGDFLGNHTSGFNNTYTGGGAIDNRADFSAKIGKINGNFISNYAIGNLLNGKYTYASGGAIKNGGIIDVLNGNFFNNAVYTYSIEKNTTETSRGGALFNSGTINNLAGDFVGNYAYSSDIAYGGAIYNSGLLTISTQIGKDTIFSDNYVMSDLNEAKGGAIYNSGTINLIAEKENKIIFATNTDTIYNIGNLNAKSGIIELQSVSNIGNEELGNFHISGADVYLADGAIINQNNIIIESGTLNINMTSQSIHANIINNATVFAVNGTITNSIDGSGILNISGNVFNQNNISQNSINLNADSSFTNHTTGSITVNNFVGDGELINDGNLYFNGIALNTNITGSGNLIINNNVVSNANIAQKININPNKSLTIDISNLQSDVVNNGDLLINGDGTLSNSVSGNGIVNITNSVASNADNFDIEIINDGILQLTGGTLTHNVSGQNGTVQITGHVNNTANIAQQIEITDDAELTSNATNIGGKIQNSGQLYLTGGTLNIEVSGIGTININGEVSGSANNFGNNIINNDTLTLNGGTLLSQIYGNGKIIIGDELTANANLLSGKIINNYALNLTGGTLSNSVSGNGIVNITNSVASNADNFDIEIINDGILQLTGGTLTHNVSGQNGTVQITGHVNNTANIAQQIEITTNASLISNANNIDGNIQNFGELNLMDGNLNANISGTGITYISGCVFNNAIISQNLNIDTGASLFGSADGLGINVYNFGELNLTGGMLKSQITGTGNINIVGNVVNNSILSNKLFISGQFTTDASKIQSDFINNGRLVFTGGTNTNAISGTGNVEIQGAVENKAQINQDVSIRYDGQLTSSADVLLGNITNLGILNLSGGTIKSNIGGGIINIVGDIDFADFVFGGGHINMYANMNIKGGVVGASNFVVNDGTKLNFTNNVMRDNTLQVLSGGLVDIVSTNMAERSNTIEINDGGIVNISDTNAQGTKFSINKGGILNADASSLYVDIPNRLYPHIENAGTINISDGDLLSPIYGDGVTNIIGQVNNTGYISNSIRISNSGQFTTAANKFHKTVLNDGILNLTDGDLVADISGNGITNINGNVNINSDITNLQSTTVAHGAALDIHTANVNVSDMLLNGDLKLTIQDLMPYSTEYTGGKLNVTNDLTLGTDARLVFTFDSSVKLNKGEYTGNLSLITAGGNINGSWADVLSNNRYSINETPDKGTFEIIYIKDADEVVAGAGGSKNNANTALAWDSLTGVSGQTELIRQKLNDLSQHDAQTYVKTLEQIAPTHAQVVSNTTRVINSLINKQITERLNVISGHNGGDSNNIDAGLWAMGFINHSAQTGDSEYNGNTYGIAVGGDIAITNDIKAGIAYVFNSTDADATERTIGATGHNFALYGQYDLSKLALNALISYGVASYTDNTQLVDSEYKSNNFGLNISADYAFSGNWTGFAGTRYLMVSQDKYTDSIGQQISIDDSHILTLGVGGKYSDNIEMFGLAFNPVISAALTYDVLNSEHTAIVNIANAVYQITGDTIDPLGLEIGLALEKSIGNWNFGLKYDLELHNNFNSHTGQIIFRYAF